MTNTWRTLFLYVGSHPFWKRILENRMLYKTMYWFVFSSRNSCTVGFYFLSFMPLKIISNCMHRPKDFFWDQSTFRFSALDRYSEHQNQYVCNACLHNCTSSCRKPSQQLLLRTCDKFSNPLTVVHACFQKMFSQLPSSSRSGLLLYF